MTHLSDLMPPELLDRHLTDGLIRRTYHPYFPLSILNYSSLAQYSGTWDEATTNCRGLITDDRTNMIVARGFAKFRNIQEHDQADPRFSWPFTVGTKCDGSLGVCTHYEGETFIATRGSFTSDQAIWATKWLHEHHPDFTWPDDTTPLFEIVYPANRIVIAYDKPDLIFLGLVDNATGNTITFHMPGFTAAETFAGTCPPHEIAEAYGINDGNHEGFVLTFHGPKGEQFRVKSKLSEYVRLHAIITQSSTLTVWQALSEGVDPSTVLDTVPDEYASWVRATVADLDSQYDSILAEAHRAFEAIAHLIIDRKAFAAEAVKSPHRGLLFALLDGKDIGSAIWKQIRPEHARPQFAQAEEVA